MLGVKKRKIMRKTDECRNSSESIGIWTRTSVRSNVSTSFIIAYKVLKWSRCACLDCDAVRLCCIIREQDVQRALIVPSSAFRPFLTTMDLNHAFTWVSRIERIETVCIPTNYIDLGCNYREINFGARKLRSIFRFCRVYFRSTKLLSELKWNAIRQLMSHLLC